jgi:cytochrome b561
MYWMDTPWRYGAISRLLHWTMALLLAWEFTGVIVYNILGKHPVSAFFNGTHSPIGAVLFCLILIRVLWALCNWRRRPTQSPNVLGWFARVGHLVLYVVMLVLPSLGLLRAYGSGKGFTPFGVVVFPATGVRVDWMVAPANLLHGVLGWTLMALVAGHIGMVVIHKVLLGDEVAARMMGSPKAR